MEEKSTKPRVVLSSNSSGQHRLEATLRCSDSIDMREASAMYREECPTPSTHFSIDSEDGQPKSGEVEYASVKLTESVDRICDALVMVFGKISKVSDAAKQQSLILESISRWLVGVAVVQVVLFVFNICILVMFMVSK